MHLSARIAAASDRTQSILGGVMRFRNCVLVFATLTALFLLSPLAYSDSLGFFYQGGVLANAPSYLWDYGCSPTAAGMMMGYYDINGYGGLRYNNLVPGGQAELSTWPQPPSSSPLVDAIIASPGHIADFYGGDNNRGNNNYNNAKDDLPGPYHAFNSLADFMGTSQDSAGNKDGWTTFGYFNNGNKYTAQDALNAGLAGKDGTYGLWEYFDQYAGYTAPMTNFFTQLTDKMVVNGGFTFNDYMNDIDAGMVVMIQLDGHSMFGYGYDQLTQTIDFHDTWDSQQHNMAWGGVYAGMGMIGVTVFQPAGGSSSVPEPTTLVLLGSGCFVLLCLGKKLRC